MLLKKSFIIAIAFILLSKFTLAGWTVGFTTTQNDTICFGTVLKLHGYTNTGCPFTWSIPPMATCFPSIYATNVEISFSAPGEYYIAISTTGCFSALGFKKFIVLPTPIVSLTTSLDSICNSSDAILLSGGFPTGGIYSGAGIIGNTFDPSYASYDSSYIYYEYADWFGCSSNDSSMVYITTDCDITETINTISIYPNPTSGEITFKGIESEVSIADISGKEVMHFNSSDQTSVYLNASPGIYFYNVRDKNGGTTKGKILLTK